MNIRVSLDNTTCTGQSVLCYGFHLLPVKIGNVEYLSDAKYPICPGVDPELRKNLNILALDVGIHKIPYNNYTLSLDVKQSSENTVFLYDNQYILKIFDICVLETPKNSDSIISMFILDSKKYIKSLNNDIRPHTFKNYVFNEKFREWDYISSSQKRNVDSLFLEEGMLENVIGFVTDFIKQETKEDYYKFSIPYKANLLFYGVAGCGKTSLGKLIASVVDSDIAIINFTSAMDDNMLIRAMNSIKNIKKCHVVILEDIDSLFIDRKENDTQKNSVTLSGILNVLDGLSSPDNGLITILTTNTIHSIDEAMLRPGRIDFKMKFEHSSEYVVRNMFNYYFGDEPSLFEQLYKNIEYLKITPCMLQQFFFMNRKAPERMLTNISHLIKLTNFEKNYTTDTELTMYS